MHQQLWGYKVEEKLNLGVREQKGLNTTGIKYRHLCCFFGMWMIAVAAGLNWIIVELATHTWQCLAW
jgi:hypothetical protein